MDKNVKVCPSCGAKNGKSFYKKWWFLLLIVVVVVAVISSVGGNGKEKIHWNEMELGDRLPEPQSDKGRVISNNSEYLSIYVEEISQSDYSAYIEECKNMGYTIDSEKNGNVYDAFDEEGYDLSLSYIVETMYIELKTPAKMEILNWPSSKIAGLLPVPESNIGKVEWEASYGFVVYVGETSEDDYNDYVNACAENGFTEDYQKGDDFYYADNIDGYHLSLRYEGNDTMFIRMDEPDSISGGDEESELAEEETTNDGGNASEDNGVDPKLKAFLDEYEAFMNEYIEFMKTYENAGDTSALLDDYADMMQQYAEFTEKAESYDTEEMSAADAAYYSEVVNRVNQKLLAVAY